MNNKTGAMSATGFMLGIFFYGKIFVMPEISWWFVAIPFMMPIVEYLFMWAVVQAFPPRQRQMTTQEVEHLYGQFRKEEVAKAQQMRVKNYDSSK